MTDTGDRLAQLMSAHRPMRDIETRRVLSEVRKGLLRRGDVFAVGRFEGVERIGHGGMGVVYRAWDPLLGRSVAIKVLNPANDGARIMAEAKTLASLAHPNIVQILDVQREGEELFVVMEYVEGKTLAEVLALGLPLVDLLPLFEQMARGVAAAHEASIVHRDIKPSNALVSPSGVLRLVDFGLSRPVDGKSHGAFGGTMGYAAPEQVAGTAPDTRSDIFSMTAVVFSAIYRRPPAADGRIPSRPRVSPSLRRFMRRGLAPEPTDRFGSAQAWWRSLRRAVQGPPWLGLGSLGVAGVAALAAVGMMEPSAAPEVCTQLDSPWGASNRQTLKARIEGLEAGPRRDLVSGLAEALDRFSSEWERVQEMACRLNDRQAQACARGQHAAVDEIVASLEGLSDDELSRVRALTDEVPVPSRCLEREPIPVEDLELVETLEVDLARSRAMLAAGRHEDALALLRSMTLPIESARFADQIARHALHHASALKLSGEFEAAATQYEKSYLLAMTARRWAIAARAAALAAGLLAYELDDPSGARRWIRSAEAAAGRGGAVSDVTRGTVAAFLAQAYFELGDVEGAARAYERAKRLLGENRMEIRLETLHSVILFAQGDAEAALRRQREALELARALLGDRHSRLVVYIQNLGLLHQELGHVERAAALFDEALELSIEAFGPEHVSTARLRIAVGTFCAERRPASECAPTIERGLADLEALVGPTHVDLNVGLQALASAYVRAGQLDEAERTILRALDAAEQPQLPPRLRIAVFDTYARVLRAQNRLDEGLVAARRALGVVLESFGESHPHAALVREEIGRNRAAAGDDDEARAEFGRALDVAREVYGAEHEITVRIRDRLDAISQG